MTKESVIKEVLCGNGNQFTVKEILQAHIKDDNEFKAYVRDRFETGTGKIAANRAKIESITKILTHGVAPIITSIIIAIIITFLRIKP